MDFPPILVEAVVISKAMVFIPTIFYRGDGFGPRQWNFFELIAKCIATFNRDSRVGAI